MLPYTVALYTHLPYMLLSCTDEFLAVEDPLSHMRQFCSVWLYSLFALPLTGRQPWIIDAANWRKNLRSGWMRVLRKKDKQDVNLQQCCVLEHKKRCALIFTTIGRNEEERKRSTVSVNTSCSCASKTLNCYLKITQGILNITAVFCTGQYNNK